MRAIKWFILLLVAGICSCKQPKDLIYKNIENIGMKQAGLNQTTLSLDIRLYNPNKYSLKLKKADVDVFLNASHLGKVTVNDRVVLPGFDTSSLPVLLDVDLKNVLPNALQLLLDSKVNLKVTGTIKAGRHGLYITIPVNYEEKQDILSGIKW